MFSDRLVSQKGSGSHVIVGLVVLIVGWAAGSAINNNTVIYVAAAIGLAIIISSILKIIKQYERAITLRLGKYQHEVGPGLQVRLPFVDNILVVDIRERVGSLRPSGCLRRIMFRSRLTRSFVIAYWIKRQKTQY